MLFSSSKEEEQHNIRSNQLQEGEVQNWVGRSYFRDLNFMLGTASGWLGLEGARPLTSWLLVHAVAALLCALKTHRNPTSAEIGESLTPKGFLRIGIPVPHS